MNFEYSEARNLMVENQLRPNKINDKFILNLFNEIKKEEFLEDESKFFSYNDSDIDLTSSRGYLKNLNIAQLISKSEIKNNYKILHVGGLTGYVSVMLSKLCKELIVIENDMSLIHELNKNIEKMNITNIKIINSNLSKGYQEESPYNLIFIDNPIEKIPNEYIDQLNSNMGIIVMVEKINDELSKAYKIIKNKESMNKEYLFDVFTKYELFSSKKDFVF